jgi:acetyl-CoA C-acetyltransferase
MVRILGGYQTDFSRNWAKEGRHLVESMTEAINNALSATKLDPVDVGTIHVGNFAAELYTMQAHLGALAIEAHLNLRGKPSSRHEAACASGSIAVLAGCADIEAGNYQTALILGIEQMKTVPPEKGGEFLGTAAWYEKEARTKQFPFPTLFGQLGEEYVSRFDFQIETYQDYLSNLMYQNARHNPKAQTRAWEFGDSTTGSPSKPNHKISPNIKVSDCSQITDGAVALILASEEFAQDYSRKQGIPLEEIPVIQGWGHTTAPILLEQKFRESKTSSSVLPHTRKAITDAYSRARINGPEHLDAVEFHDCFTTTAYASIDLIGLTEPGNNYQAIEQGWLELDGKLPLNPSGGLIGAGHPVGATGVRQLLDAFQLVTGNAGAYQIDINSRRVLTVNIGGTGTTNVAFIVGTV